MDYQGKKCLIAYFSHAGMNYVSGKIVDLPVGNTERAAQMLRLFTGGDLFHIRTASVYPNDYQEVVKIAKKEKADNARPVLERDIDSIDDYDVIFLGYPNWCGTMAPPLMTFLQQWDWSGKKILPFGTNGGGGTGRLAEDVARLVPNGKIAPVLDLPDPEDTEKIRRWLEAQL